MAPELVERKLAAIMFTDIVGYTALMARDEEAARRTRDRQEAVVRWLVEQYHGAYVEGTGDETLSSFPSALDAVDCALAIQAELTNDPELQIRIGIHLGDVTFDSGRVSGDGVNVASRIRPLAEPGGICISDEVHHSVRGRTNFEFRVLGEQELKNVDRPVAVFSVTGTASPPRPSSAAPRRRGVRAGVLASVGVAALIVAGLAAWWLKQVGTDLTPIRSIAVLPLENLSGDPEQEYFADGMTEALIGDLAKLGSLSVISRTSVMRYKQSDKSLPQIAQELNVDGVIEGTVLREGNVVRITAQLIDARNDTHVWADRFDRELSGVLALQSEVARAVAEQVRLELTPQERAALAASRPVDPRAYDAYLRGLKLGGPPSTVAFWGPRAVERFERAVKLDPEFAEGWAALGAVRGMLANLGLDVRYRSELPRARAAVQRALELDDRLVLAHSMGGYIRLRQEWDFPGARRAFEQALRYGPSAPEGLSGYAFYLLWVEGKTQEALALSERLVRVAPFDVFYRAERLGFLVNGRRYERALEELERIREFAPDFVDLSVAALYVNLGRLEEASRSFIALFEQCGAPCDWQGKAWERGWDEGGWEGAVHAWLAAATESEGISPWVIAVAYVWVGETDEAFAWLERGYRERDPMMIELKCNPVLDPLRSDPRFDDLLRRIGFPES